MSTHETDRAVMCRICTALSLPEASSNLFECRVADGYNLAEVVALVGDVPVRVDETGLPVWCCFQCQMDVEMAYRVRVLCQESDRKLREILQAAIMTSEPVEEEEPETFETSDVVWKMEVEEPTLGRIAECEEDGEQIDYNEETEFPESEAESSNLDAATYPDVCEEIPNTKKRCCGCDQLFDSVEEILEHSKKEHVVINPPRAVKDRVVCDICHRLMDKRYLELHKETPKTMFRCTTCGELFFTQKKATRHHFNEHASTTTCCGCELRFETEEALREHSEQVHLPHRGQADSANPSECNICYQTFTSDAGLYIHRCRQGSTEEKQKFKCSHCPKLLATREALQFHEYGHQNPFSWKCTRCAEVFTDYSTYRGHLSTHRVPKEKCFRYKTYGDMLKFREELRNHELGEPKKFQCEHCPAWYTRNNLLTRHIKKVHLELPASTTEGESNSSEKEEDDDPVEEPTAPET